MASYQDIETRLRVVEDKLQFVMTALRMRGAIQGGLVGPDGQPQIVDRNLLEWYRLVKQEVLEIESKGGESLPVSEANNG